MEVRFNPDLGHSVPQGWRQLLLAEIATGVHSCHHVELRVRLNPDRLAARLLCDRQDPVLLKHRVQALKHRVIR